MKKTIDRFALIAFATPKRRRIAAWVIKFGAVFLIFLIFFIPVWRNISISSSNMQFLKNEIKGLKDISVNLMTPQEFKDAEQRVTDFKGRLLDYTKTGELLDFITQEAEESHFRVVQVYSDSPVVIKDTLGKDLELDGKKLLWIPVNFRVETDFKSMGNFLKSLKDKAQGNFVIESMSLVKTAPDSEALQCDLTLSFVGK